MKISMRITFMALLALCLSLFAMSAMAQSSTTGTIEGTVVDTNGAPVPNVTITVTSPNLIRAQTAQSNDEGLYRILNLPPGRYAVTVAAAGGFAAFEQREVEVNLSKTSNVTVTLQAAGASAVVDVNDTSGAAVDTTTNTSGSNVSTEQFSNFPTQRTVQSLYSIAPTTTQSGLRDASGRARDPSVGGSSGPENNYILDGINVTDPGFGGSGANLPFEFVQEVEIKTGAYGAEYGRATGGIFNVITKSGGNDIRGDIFAFTTRKSFVRETKNFSPVDPSTNGFSEIDAGFDIGGPIIKDKLWFFGAFNPQRRENFFLAQTLRTPLQSKVTTPFYAGKITYGINQNNTFTFSTFGDFTKQEGLLFGGAPNDPNTGFGADPNSFLGTRETGGSNYAFRLNSTITPTWIGEFSFGLHKQRANVSPLGDYLGRESVTDNFAVVRADGTVAPITQSGINAGTARTDPNSGRTGFVDFVNSPGGTLARNFISSGFGAGLFQTNQRDRTEFSAKLQNIFGRHTFKYGFEYNRNKYNLAQASSGPTRTFGNPLGLTLTGADNNTANGFRVTNRYGICTTRGTGAARQIVCPNSNLTALAALITGPTQANAPGGAITAAITAAEVNNNPFLVRLSTRVRDFSLNADTNTNVESFYIQDDYKLARNVQFNFGLRWDYQQSYSGAGESYIKFNNFKDNLQPRVGLIYDFTGQGKGKLFVNYARFVEAPLPLDVNVRAAGGGAQIDKNFNVNRLNAVAGSTLVPGIRAAFTTGAVNLGADATPIDPDLKPQTVNEVTAGIEREVAKDLALGFRGIYRAQGTVIEDGSFDDGDTYFLFNPGESLTDRLAESTIGTRFGRARRYYRALEFTATKRFTNNYQFIASYVYSSLIGNYEGLFRNDNGQSDPNITSLFDLVSLLENSYGRLPNDRPHQFKFDGSYRTPFRLLIGGSYRAQSGIPLNQLTAHPVYGNNEGFGVPRGTAGRTPTTYNLDLNAYYPIVFSENRQLRFQVDWFNVFNSQRAVKQDEAFVLTTGVSGVPDVPNPTYGAGRFFQFPSSVRVGVKFQF